MQLTKEIRTQITKAITEIGESVATIKEIEKKVPLERHALSKYLHIMERMGYLEYRSVGKAKVWFINKAPLKTIFKALPENMTFSEQLLFDLISDIPVGIILIDKNFKILFINNKIERKYGDIEEKLLYKSIFDYNNPLKLKKVIDIFDKKTIKSYFETKDRYGNILKIRASRFINPNEEVSVVLILDDITSSKKTRERLRLVQQFFSVTLDRMKEVVILTDNNQNIIEANTRALQLLGYAKKADFLGKNIMEFIDEEKHKEKIKNLDRSSKDFVFKCRIKTKKGNLFSSEISCSLVKNNKSLHGILFVFSAK
ncbi:PAS domain S-box protein [Candidatus Woesearchaeota archaeon]|nr:PAS domain S-box protein [Candidatus Woesearchaeota archaeon]